jgi:hypothetical protein
MCSRIKPQAPRLYVGIGVCGSGKVVGTSVLSPHPTSIQNDQVVLKIMTVGGGAMRGQKVTE